jgi:hypothetical protein
MSPPRDPDVSTFRWLWSKVRYGLVLHGLRNRLSRLGLEFKPYYWVLEGAESCTRPQIKGNISEYSIEFLSPEDMKIIGTRGDWYNEEMLLGFLEKGKKCIGIKHKGEIAAFMWIDFEECNFIPHFIRLKENEAYLFGMFTIHKYRGHNIAPYLRYKSYEKLRELGKDTLYSISEYFNYSTIKFKNKLKAKHLKLILYIELFKKIRWSITLRKYI